MTERVCAANTMQPGSIHSRDNPARTPYGVATDGYIFADSPLRWKGHVTDIAMSVRLISE